MDNERGFDSVRLGRLERERLLNALEQPTHRGPTHQKRMFQRVTFRQTNVPITVESYGGSLMRFRVCARNISKGGMGFLHGGFLHPGNPCDVVLTTLDGERQVISGKIAQCRFVTGRLHEVGVKFVHPINPALFCKEAASVDESAGVDSDAAPNDEKPPVSPDERAG